MRVGVYVRREELENGVGVGGHCLKSSRAMQGPSSEQDKVQCDWLDPGGISEEG